MNQKPSPAKISKLTLLKFNYDDEGNDFEKLYWPSIKDKFSEIENLWKFFVPMTNRVVLDRNDKYYYDHREDVDIKIKKMAISNFLIFFHIICSMESFHSPANMKCFKYFYINLGIICDLINNILYRLINILEFLDASVILGNIDKNKISELKEQLEVFVEKDENPKLENKDHKKLVGKVLGYLFKDSQIINNYSDFSTSISRYRNIIVHQSNIHPIPYKGEFIVPNEDRIDDYKIRMHAAYEIERITDLEKERDFKEVGELLRKDFDKLSENINNIWKKIILIFEEEIFNNRNLKILSLYNIEIE